MPVIPRGKDVPMPDAMPDAMPDYPIEESYRDLERYAREMLTLAHRQAELARTILGWARETKPSEGNQSQTQASQGFEATK